MPSASDFPWDRASLSSWVDVQAACVFEISCGLLVPPATQKQGGSCGGVAGTLKACRRIIHWPAISDSPSLTNLDHLGLCAPWNVEVQRLKFSAKNRAHTRAELEEANRKYRVSCARHEVLTEERGLSSVRCSDPKLVQLVFFCMLDFERGSWPSRAERLRRWRQEAKHRTNLPKLFRAMLTQTAENVETLVWSLVRP